MTSLAINTLAIARMGIGAASLVAPLQIASAFLLPVAPIAILPIRLAGARDLAIGGLLWHASRTQSVPLVGNKNEQQSLLGKDNLPDSNMLRSVLWVNIAVDAIDVLSVAACLAEGAVPLDGGAVFIGGAMAFVGLGSWALMKMK
jgi:hypothetical protein